MGKTLSELEKRPSSPIVLAIVLVAVLDSSPQRRAKIDDQDDWGQENKVWIIAGCGRGNKRGTKCLWPIRRDAIIPT